MNSDVASVPPAIVRVPADSMVPSSTSSVYGEPMMSWDCAPSIDRVSIWGLMSSVIVPALLRVTL